MLTPPHLGALIRESIFPGAEDELGFMIIAGGVWGVGIGTSFSAILAIAARGRSLNELSCSRVASVGVLGGLLLAGLVVGGSWGDWPNGAAIIPFSILPLLGAGGGVASLLVARNAGRPPAGVVEVGGAECQVGTSASGRSDDQGQYGLQAS